MNKILPVSFLFAGCLLASTGCGDRTINPFENIAGYYSVYGALSVGSDDNYVRIRRVDTPLLADSADFNGKVYFQNLSTNAETELQDTIIEFEGNYTHNFRVKELIQPNTNYKIRIEDGEGNVTESTTSTPSISNVTYSPNMDVICNTPIELVLGNFVDSERVLFEIGFFHDGIMNWDRMDLFHQFINYDYTEGEVSIEMSPKNYLVEVFTPPLPDNPYYDPYELDPTVKCFEVSRRVVYIRYYHLSPEWSLSFTNENNLPPLDIEAGVIYNGIGFFGGYHTNIITIAFEAF